MRLRRKLQRRLIFICAPNARYFTSVSMNNNPLPDHQEIIEDLSFFDDWEQRYEYIIDLGKMLPKLDDANKTPGNIVKGCQSDVWLVVEHANDAMNFKVESDAIIVNGLLALLMCAYQGKSPADILAFDIEKYFTDLDLESHITPTRGNGLRAIVGKIRESARNA